MTIEIYLYYFELIRMFVCLTLKVSNTKLKNDSSLKDKVNGNLNEVGREFKDD